MSGSRRGPPAAALRAFSVLLRLYPRRHRLRFAAQMRQFFIDEYEARRGEVGRALLFAFLLRTYVQLVAHAFAARLDALAKHGGSTVGGAGEAAAGAARTFRRAVRRLVRSPGYSFTSIATLALGIGATATVYGVVYPVLVAPLSYPAPDQLVAAYEQSPGPDGSSGWVSPLTFRDWRERTTRLEGLAGWRLSLLTWTGPTEPTSLRGWAVSSGFFRILGLPMALGRGFSREEDEPGGAPVVVISRGLWERSFGADAAVLGRTMTLDGVPRTIVGVANGAVDFPSAGEYWVPLALDYGVELRDFRYLGVVGRVREGVTLMDARSELSDVAKQVSLEHPDTNEGWGSAMVSLKEDLVGNARPVLLGMAGAVVLLLLIGLGNVVSLSVARGVDRRGEQGVRRALGASRWNLVGEVVAETVALSAVGGGLGLAAASFGIRVLAGHLDAIPRSEHIAADAHVLAFVVVVAFAVGLAVGLLSVLLPGRGVGDAIGRSGSRGTSSARAQGARAVVLTAQVALAFTLLVGGSLLARSLVALTRVDLGFTPAGMISFAVQLPSDRYADAEAWRDFYTRAVDRVDGLPEVRAAAAVTPLPLAVGSVPTSWALPADLRSPLDPPVMAHMRTATPGYLAAMGIRLRAGRFFDDTDRHDARPVAVVNAAFVERYLNDGDVLGVRISSDDPGDDATDWRTIVGVVDDVRFRSITATGEPEIYLPMTQFASSWGYLVVRSPGGSAEVVRAVTDAVHRIDPNLPMSDVRTGRALVAGQLSTSRLVTALGGLFAVAATSLAVVGILGLLSILVSRRMKELGLRMVFGAPTASIRWFVLGKGLRPVAAGLVVGVGVSLAASRLLGGMLEGRVSPRDPVTYLLAALVFASVSTLACLRPALRAGKTDPVTLMRSE